MFNLNARESRRSKEIDDFAAKENANLAATSSTLDGIASGVTGLDNLITGFQNSPGTLSPADQAMLDEIVAASAALVTKAAAISTAPPQTGASVA